MNERIKQLAEQARDYAEGKQNDPYRIYTLDCFNEKFAELIVRECQDNLAWHGHDEAVSQLDWLKVNRFGLKS